VESKLLFLDFGILFCLKQLIEKNSVEKQSNPIQKSVKSKVGSGCVFSSTLLRMPFYYEVYVSSVKQREIAKTHFNLLHPDLGSTSEWLVHEGNFL